MIVPTNCPVCYDILKNAFGTSMECDKEDHLIYYSVFCQCIEFKTKKFDIEWNFKSKSVSIFKSLIFFNTDWFEPDFSNIEKLKSKILTMILLP